MVMSTTLLIGRWPAAVRRPFSHGGDGPIVTSSKTRAVKRGQRSGHSTRISTPSTESPAGWGSSSHGALTRSAPVAACASRATP